ncbi:MAG: HAD family hydrolase [Candidatus Tectimicrobiota bacterium]
MSIQGIIFDYGRVLAHTLYEAPRATWEQRLGLGPGMLTRAVHNDHTWIAAQQGHLSIDAHWQAVGTALGLTPTDTLALRAAFYRGDVLNDELVACLDTLRARGLRTALLSNFSADLRDLLAQQDLLRRFDVVAISAEIGVMKPAPAAYQHVLARLGLEPTACVFIDDIPANVQAARALGVHGIVFEDNTSCLAALAALLQPQCPHSPALGGVGAQPPTASPPK